MEPFPPPLGGGLYEELVTAFPETWGALEEDEKSVFGGDGPGFEAGMQLLWEKFDERASPALIDMAIYFSRFRPPRDQSDCYSRLIIALRALGLIDCARAANLNYECLLEIASCRVGVNINYSGEPHPGTLSVAKPHGSCNFLVDMNVQNVTIVGSPAMQNLVLGELDIIGNLDEVEPTFRSGYSIPPIMSMFAETKHTPVNWQFVAEMRDDWRKWAEIAAVIVIVGAQPYFRDNHIWDPLLTSDASVWYIGGTRGDFELFATRLGSRLERLGGRFDECLKPLLERLRDLREASLVVEVRESEARRAE